MALEILELEDVDIVERMTTKNVENVDDRMVDEVFDTIKVLINGGLETLGFNGYDGIPPREDVVYYVMDGSVIMVDCNKKGINMKFLDSSEGKRVISIIREDLGEEEV